MRDPGLGAAGSAVRVHPAAALRAMQVGESVRRVFSASPWCSENTLRAVFVVSHHMPAPQCIVVQKLARWLRAHAVWDRWLYTDREIPPCIRPDKYTAPWSSDFSLLLQLSFSLSPSVPMCVIGWWHPIQLLATVPSPLLCWLA